MEGLIKFIGGIMLVLGALFVGVLSSTVIGAVIGWTVGLVYDDTLRALASWAGLDAPAWQLGAMLGFVSAFFRPPAASK